MGDGAGALRVAGVENVGRNPIAPYKLARGGQCVGREKRSVSRRSRAMPSSTCRASIRSALPPTIFNTPHMFALRGTASGCATLLPTYSTTILIM